MSEAREHRLQLVQRVLRHMHARLKDPLDLASLAGMADLSPPHLNVVFQGIVGESLYQHLKRIRLERAAVFLRLTNESVLDIALACGFDSHEGFTRSFAQKFRCSPRAFRAGKSTVTNLPARTNIHYAANGVPDDFQPMPDLGRSLKVDLVELPRQRLACLRHQGSYQQAHRVWPPFLWWAMRTGRLGGDNVFYGLSYDDEEVTPAELQRYDAAMVVPESFPGDGQVAAVTLEGGLFARTTVIGTFEDYWRASEAFLCQWLPDSGFALRGFYSLDRYHVAGNLLNPVKLLNTLRKQLHVDLFLPVGPGPFGRTILM